MNSTTQIQKKSSCPFAGSSSSDLPEHFDSTPIENHDGPGPYGAKGMGESGVVCIAPAVGNALYRATGVAFANSR